LHNAGMAVLCTRHLTTVMGIATVLYTQPTGPLWCYGNSLVGHLAGVVGIVVLLLYIIQDTWCFKNNCRVQ